LEHQDLMMLLLIQQKDKYRVGEKVIADILIKNTGDIPDKDVELTYFLISPSGEKFGETKEQFLEIDIGEKLLVRSIPLPSTSELGGWEFHVELRTAIQPLISVFNPFEVLENINIIDKASEALSPIINFGKSNFKIILIVAGISIVGMFIFFNKKEEEEKVEEIY